jgi:hypothetical protein
MTRDWRVYWPGWQRTPWWHWRSILLRQTWRCQLAVTILGAAECDRYNYLTARQLAKHALDMQFNPDVATHVEAAQDPVGAPAGPPGNARATRRIK